MSPLPAAPFEYAEWKTAKVRPGYHVEVDKTFYSLPHRLIGRCVEVRLASRGAEWWCTSHGGAGPEARASVKLRASAAAVDKRMH